MEISASAVAWYGAVVATLSAVVSVYIALRDRPRLKIKYQKDMVITGAQNIYPKDKTYFNVTVINKGRRPMNISKAGLRTIGGSKKFAIFADSFSSHRQRILTEETPVSEFITEQDENLLSSAWYIIVIDATGKSYKKYLHMFPILWRVVFFLKHGK